MKRGWLITNEWLEWDKFELQFDDLLAAAEGVLDLSRVSTDWVVSHLDGDVPDVALVMDKDVAAVAQLEALGVRTVNTAKAIALCDNKAYTHAALTRAGIAHPATITAPLAYRALSAQEWENSDFVAAVESQLGYPAVAKHAVGSWGSGVFVVHNRSDLVRVVMEAYPAPVIVEKFIAESAGRDMRLYMVEHEAVAGMRRFGSDGDFRANITGGGKAEPWDPPAEHVDVARRAMDALGLDIAAVDFLEPASGQPLVGEVNSNAQFVTLAKATGVDVASHVIDYLVRVAEEK
ncbi:RimK family alpha-L-glutamate ligase [Corynebacterium sp. MSK044]|uniref:ATP-grasp domain-containing protein n=1 Tax=Corynebacterium sp. MSK044 TaxID=3050195 RepID=UPI00254F15B3|nr:RimK family alpha-L-glutamate ligase [Corynebacterium sp. MSK044]MDK8796539.1 RimK family alpha-L-glutamate ligase [Corynebacterium sp. MSK044]